MRVKKAAVPAPPEPLVVRLSTPLTPAHAELCLRDAVCSLLFLRGQLPYLYAVLRKEREALGSSTTRRSAYSRRLCKAVDGVSALCAAVTPDLLSAPSLRSVFVVLGSAPSRPREAYELSIPVANGFPAREGRGEEVAQRITRALVQTVLSSAVAPPLTRCFLLLRCSSSAADTPPGFVLRRSLRPAFAKARIYSRLQLQLVAGGSATAAAMASDDIWFVSRASYRGARLTAA